MKYFFSPVSFNKITQKLCINCKFYRNHFFISSEFGECAFSPKEKYSYYYLVNGKNDIEYEYCAVSRNNDNMCGKEGKFYEKK